MTATQIFAEPPEAYRANRRRLLSNMLCARKLVRRYDAFAAPGCSWRNMLRAEQRVAAQMRANWQNEIKGWAA